jgi:predicted protein tyrosine phosphatase
MEVSEFYKGGITPEGLTWEKMLAFTPDRFETHHAYVQWAFPTTQQSNFNPDVPILTPHEIEEFRTSAQEGTELASRLVTSWLTILNFYGFRYSFSDMKVYRKDGFDPETVHWLARGDHNYLRITRILQCMRICGLEVCTQAFFAALDELYQEFPDYIGPTTYRYWKDAAMDPELIKIVKEIADKSYLKTYEIDEEMKKVGAGEKMYFGRPLLGKILVLPRRNVKEFRYSEGPWACISIADSQDDFPFIDDSDRVDLLQMKFDDIEWARETFVTFNEGHAKEIVEFASKVWEKVDLIVIHCNAGISRSTAVGKGISKFYQPEFTSSFDKLWSPNKLVYDLLHAAFEGAAPTSL